MEARIWACATSLGGVLRTFSGREREPAERDVPDRRFGLGSDVVHSNLPWMKGLRRAPASPAGPSPPAPRMPPPPGGERGGNGSRWRNAGAGPGGVIGAARGAIQVSVGG